MIGMMAKLLAAIALAVLLLSGSLNKPLSDAATWFGDKAAGWLTDTIEDTQEDADRQRRERERKERRKLNR